MPSPDYVADALAKQSNKLSHKKPNLPILTLPDIALLQAGFARPTLSREVTFTPNDPFKVGHYVLL